MYFNDNNNPVTHRPGLVIFVDIVIPEIMQQTAHLWRDYTVTAIFCALRVLRY